MSTSLMLHIPELAHPLCVPISVSNLSEHAVQGYESPTPAVSVLIVVTGGGGYAGIRGQLHSLTAGSILACAEVPQLEPDGANRLQGIWIDYISLSPHTPSFSRLTGAVPLHQVSSGTVARAAALHHAWNEPQEGQPFAVQQLFAELLTEIYSGLAAKLNASGGWFGPVLKYIEAHYNEDLTREQMAVLAGVSPEHFSRTFRRMAGQTFSTYLNLLRIRRAQLRLLTGKPSLTALAQEVGYGEGTYLSRKFKQIVGVSPTVYHQRTNKKVAALNYNHTASLRALQITPCLGAYSAWHERLESVPAAQKLHLNTADDTLLYDSVAAAEPDVIISYSLPRENRSLVPLAPVLELPYMQMSWRQQFRRIADVVDRRQQAEEWLLSYSQLCSEANLQLDRSIGAVRGSAIVWEISTRSAYCFAGSYGRGCHVLYGDLGFYPPSLLIDNNIMGSGYLEAPIEQIPGYPADYIFITGLPTDAEGSKRVGQLFLSSAWCQLEAVRNRQVYILDEADMFYGFDPLSSLAQLQVLLQALTS
ncbi:AraC family transcriptional regulator [Paenibacillus donghaensis]|uniref:Fe3+-hydroxamate ABC transporter substrate-binding protein n=1 Tax=Paenibacillus donghaensis TaxID=414771 RepID=A0A2Z2KEC2_9BACL|nr:AraC family transcriptional regulator [Paenibacillus donghaensis]ASA21470.1 hypothetical protein B9T62_12185 [Paenibacillus donghaensis]